MNQSSAPVMNVHDTGQNHMYRRGLNNPEIENYLDQMYPAELAIKGTTESITSASYLDLLSIGRDSNFTLPFTTNEMISVSTSQTLRTWVVIFYLRRPMAYRYLSLSLYDTPGIAPNMNVFFWGPGDFPVRYSNSILSWNAWNRHSWMFMVDTGIFFSNMKSPSHECYMTFWPSTSCSDFPTDQTFHQFHDLCTELNLHWITSCFHWAFATGVTCQ